ncbi:UDP-N-acetylmuramoyl-L-alanyl-D-glutamate--2,6-diaminopimelate ligase [Candidatus Peregrinibacteria bacterium]|nr:UDP-N-acetylmuramoyl-L-alanyl-D-glutamate--2,6-diaminopimelate ligase [Candidatus Peregrinibacteria bacterium]
MILGLKNYLDRLVPRRHPIRLFYHKTLAALAAIYYGFPASQMTVIAVTGTKGKSTTANMIHAVLSEAGKSVGMLTTVNFKIGAVETANVSEQTTLSPFPLQRMLKKMRAAGCEIIVLEVTSHAIVQSRIWGVNIDTAVFTNLASEHLDYHGDFEEYRNAKGIIFKNLNPSPRKAGVAKISIVNADDPEHAYFESFQADQQFAYGIQNGAYNARNLEQRPNGTKFLLKIPNGEVNIDLKIPGRMNVYNALAAAAVGVAFHVNLETVKKALDNMPPVPGRIEIIDSGQPFTVVVDFAHTPDSLEQVLSMFKDITKGRIITVFGACGDRDTNNRPVMGGVLDKFSDIMILTDDDPHTEDHKAIAEMVRKGINRKEGDGFWQVLDRVEAIRLAISSAKEGDAVLIFGKGAQEYQFLNHKKIPHDDRKVAREILSRAVAVDLPKL